MKFSTLSQTSWLLKSLLSLSGSSRLNRKSKSKNFIKIINKSRVGQSNKIKNTNSYRKTFKISKIKCKSSKRRKNRILTIINNKFLSKTERWTKFSRKWQDWNLKISKSKRNRISSENIRNKCSHKSNSFQESNQNRKSYIWERCSWESILLPIRGCYPKSYKLKKLWGITLEDIYRKIHCKTRSNPNNWKQMTYS